uniref:Uncharacterized protein n=1 Tax=Streptomyces sp. NBC_00148 TaxID=2903626 RepID=A0AAU1M1C9_9ACTN
MYRQQTKNLLVSYSPKKLGFFQGWKRGADTGPSSVDRQKRAANTS